MKPSKLLSLFTGVFTALLVLSASIAVPLLCRPFYYAHIEALNLDGYTGLSVEQIREAFNQVMDYCLGLRPDFAAGVLPFSESGASHFADVRVLFLLDLWVAVISLAALVILFIISRRKKLTPTPLMGHGPGFWAAIGLGGLFLIVGGLAATNFERAFVIFHSLFFPGKTNWLFDWRTDPIILLLPEDFFRNCAILILTLLIFWCVILIVADLLAQHRRKKLAPPPASPCSGCPGGGDCSGCSSCS
ncbi:TIGR01906 family membrane protein [Pseudoflavonifractor phocaeensis]|uniref:TIGR01906 family membrane protein n=1 Tax=Pseudoflavonifractor phocaeensis TaxID=1870988 RepID=UPI0025A45320|nr:TIGR01906 family membrane protein [Pseudoflavonifractor phocaeensis]MDM8239258.1 TIGR01906 family membrane protein [Pseudoflavonifractor phocaeensis]